MGLTHKIVIGFILMIILLMLAHNYSLRYILEDLQLERLEKAEVTLAKSIAKRILPAILKQEIRSITSILLDEKSLRAEQVEYILVLDEQGQALADTYIASTLPTQLLKLANTFSKGQGYKLQKINAENVSVYNIAVAVRQGVKQIATVNLGIKEDYMHSIITPTQKASARAQTLTIIIAAIGIFIALFISQAITRPILKLTKLTEQISEGKLNTKIAVRSKDEIGKLALSFNRMIENLQKTTISMDRLNIEVADREKAEQELAIERYQLLSMFEGMDEVVYVSDPNNYELLYMNTAAKKNWGDKIGKKCHHVLHNLEAPCDFCTNGIIFDENMGHSYIWEGQNNINKRWFRCIDKAIRWSDGRMVHFEMAIDITERKQAEDERNNLIRQLKEEQGLLKKQKQKAEDSRKALKNVALDLEESKGDLERQKMALEQTNKELDDFTYIVSHDLKEPLRSIDAFSKFIADEQGAKLDSEAAGYLTRVRANAARMRDLIEDLLKISRIERQKNPFENVNIEKIIDEIRLRLEYAIKEKNVQISIRDKLPEVFCDRIRVAEVFANLISNAIKFMDKPQPKIEIGCQDKNGCYEFYVKDNGPGIEEQYFAKIFEIFQRLGKREEHEGTGAGLTIVKKIVKMHKGKVWVESKAKEGATFYFSIPKKIDLS